MKTIESVKGIRKIDTENQLIESASGEMMHYKKIQVKFLDGVQHFALMVTDNAGVFINGDKWRAFVNADKPVNKNWNSAAFANVMSEGCGDY